MATVSFNTQFPGYDVLGEISRSNARVLKARHIATGDIVAIKHFALNTDPDTLRRFERESAIMTQIAHPNIVRVREIRLDAELPYIVMDYVEGGSVRQLITTQGSLSVETTIRLGLQVLDAFRVIHARGIVHRDVKPENILYHTLASGELHFLLTDFGVARLHEQPVTQTGQSLMTYEYAAPEQFDNPRSVSAAADYYALGVVLYECLTGRVPFTMRNETGLVTFMNAVLTTSPPAPALPTGRLLPDRLEDLLRQLLAKIPAGRLQSPDTVKVVLKEAELEQLRMEQAEPPPAAPTPNSNTAPAPRFVKPTQPLIARPNVANVANVPPARPPVVSRAVPNRVWIGLSAGAVLLLGIGTYWLLASADRTPANHSVVAAATPTVVAPVSTTPSAADAQRQLEAARRQYQQQVLNAVKQLEVTTLNGKVGLFGGVKNLSVRLENPSPVAFRYVLVKVRYVKDNGGLFKTENVYFNGVGPYDTATQRAPDSPRGTKFSARVAGYAAATPDSLAAPLIP